MSLRDITSVAGLVVITEVALINKPDSNKPLISQEQSPS